MKEFKGKEVWLRPTGNNCSRGKPNNKRRATVVKVGRVFLTLTLGDSNYERKLRMHEGRENTLDDDFNGGYVLYASEQDLDNYYEAVDLVRKIEYKLRFTNKPELLPIKTLRHVALLLNVYSLGDGMQKKIYEGQL
jgi:hypothetical protein